MRSGSVQEIETHLNSPLTRIFRENGFQRRMHSVFIVNDEIALRLRILECKKKKSIQYFNLWMIFFSSAKGQINFKVSFWCHQFLPKTERKQVDLRYHSSKSNFFVRFLGELRIPKSPFEINWPLAPQYRLYIKRLAEVGCCFLSSKKMWATWDESHHLERLE